MIFEFEYKRSYGNKRFYPVNKNALTFCKAADITSLTHWQIRVLIEEGWQVKAFQYALDRKVDLTDEEIKKLASSY